MIIDCDWLTILIDIETNFNSSFNRRVVRRVFELFPPGTPPLPPLLPPEGVGDGAFGDDATEDKLTTLLIRGNEGSTLLSLTDVKEARIDKIY